MLETGEQDRFSAEGNRSRAGEAHAVKGEILEGRVATPQKGPDQERIRCRSTFMGVVGQFCINPEAIPADISAEG